MIRLVPRVNLPAPAAAAPIAAAPTAPAPGIAPGVLLSAAVGLFGIGAQNLEILLFGRSWLEALVLAILAGAVLRTLWKPGRVWLTGVEFSAKTLLETAVVLLGASVSAKTVLAAGPQLLVAIIAVVVLALAASYAIGRALGLSQRMATLVACGNSICGNSAIAAVAPVIGADGDEVAASIAFTAVLGVAVVIVLPVLGIALHMSGLQFGALAGLTVYAVPQVLAATTALGPVAVQIGTLVKLVRVLTLGPVCFALSLMMRRRGTPAGAEACDRPRPGLVPWFILGFLAMIALRSFSLLPAPVLGPMADAAGLLTLISMAALGLATDLSVVARAGTRVSATVALSLLVMAAVAFGAIRLLGLR